MAPNKAASRPIPFWLLAIIVGGAFAAILVAERRRPLRREVEGKFSRLPRNLAIAGLSAAALQLAEAPVAMPLAGAVHKRRIGLLPRLGLPGWLETLAAVTLLDYTLYLWHILTHRVPGLWRFHVVHHADLDLDASTALRFHFGEMTLSVPYRAAQIAAIGVSPRALSIWQTALIVSILFHHSNIRLPIALERWLCRVVVTPRMHGIHHSVVGDETDSNWSSGLAVWDWLHGTVRLNVPQEAIDIGVPGLSDPEQVTLAALVAMPFGRQPPTDTWPDGSTAGRPPLPGPRSRLLP
ncbi:MAG: sterol desaturase family protein [Acidobacteria bacterium]|nr:sterol desaturase family protein [Acidobacteriota bacterium]